MSLPTAASSRKRRAPPVRGYAKRLGPYQDKGRCGDEVPEVPEDWAAIESKIQTLATALEEARYVVVHTGAGISTSAGIKDFRGKEGIWTLEKRGMPLPGYEKCWNQAVPTLAHMALVGLMQAGRLQYIVSQNIDSLHLRSGVPRSKLSELHGNMFMEVCESCGTEQLRTVDLGGVGKKRTGRKCPRPRCGSKLADALLDWEDELPEPDFSGALTESTKCRAEGGLALCLGTSLQMCPARDLPAEAHRMVIVNLQATEMDDEAWLVLHARLDDVLFGVVRLLQVPIPVWERVETFFVHHQVTSVKHTAAAAPGRKRSRNSSSSGESGEGREEDEEEEQEDGGGYCTLQTIFRLSVGESTLLQDAPSGYLSSVVLSLPHNSTTAGATATAGPAGEEAPARVVRLEEQPFTHFDKVTTTLPRHLCPFCHPPTNSSSSSSSNIVGEGEEEAGLLHVGVTVHFEGFSPIQAGATTVPAHTPEPWHGTYSIKKFQGKDVGSQAVSTRLIKVNYDDLYRRPALAAAAAGAAGSGGDGAAAVTTAIEGGGAGAGGSAEDATAPPPSLTPDLASNADA